MHAEVAAVDVAERVPQVVPRRFPAADEVALGDHQAHRPAGSPVQRPIPLIPHSAWRRPSSGSAANSTSAIKALRPRPTRELDPRRLADRAAAAVAADQEGGAHGPAVGESHLDPALALLEPDHLRP